VGNSSLYCSKILNLHINRDEELGHNVVLTADLVNSSVDLKFFPEAPAERDVVNRVGDDFYYHCEHV